MYDVIAEVVLKVAKQIVTADDRARAEAFQALDQASRILPMGEPADVMGLASRLLNWVYAEGDARARKLGRD